MSPCVSVMTELNVTVYVKNEDGLGAGGLFVSDCKTTVDDVPNKLGPETEFF